MGSFTAREVIVEVLVYLIAGLALSPLIRFGFALVHCWLWRIGDLGMIYRRVGRDRYVMGMMVLTWPGWLLGGFVVAVFSLTVWALGGLASLLTTRDSLGSDAELLEGRRVSDGFGAVLTPAEATRALRRGQSIHVGFVDPETPPEA